MLSGCILATIFKSIRWLFTDFLNLRSGFRLLSMRFVVVIG